MAVVYIANRDRLASLKKLVDWLLGTAEDVEKVVITDSGSTYPPLLDYYEREKPKEVELYRSLWNPGPGWLWQLGLHKAQDGPFVLTDADLVPAAECPRDLLRKMAEVLARYPGRTKVGPGLKIDNLPDTLPFKDWVLRTNQAFWQQRLAGDCFEAAIDTTFAMYRTHAWWTGPDQGTNARLAPPYLMEHTPWYQWPLTEEDEWFGRRSVFPISNIARKWREAGWEG